MIGISANRVRSLVNDCKTEMDVASILRSHRIKYTFTTETGYLSIRIPCRKGCVRVYRTCDRKNRFMVRGISRTDMVLPVPVLHNDY